MALPLCNCGHSYRSHVQKTHVPCTYCECRDYNYGKPVDTKTVFVFKVTIDQDQIPGAFNDIADTQRRLQAMLDYAVNHYNPKVEITGVRIVEK